MYNIAIIGAGQLGSRHLQGLKTANFPMSIYVADNSPVSLETAKERYNQVGDNRFVRSIHYLDSIEALPENIDLAVIATPSKPRCSILEALLLTKTVGNLILEKVLFPSFQDYDIARKILLSKNLLHKTWVNCPMRLFSGYKKLKQLLEPDRPFSFELAGGNWGLACNSIHYLDLCAYLFNSSGFTVSCEELEPVVYPSKRIGYAEFMGTLHVQTQSQGSIRLTDTHAADTPVRISIKQAQSSFEIQEDNDRIITAGESFPLGLKYQSQLTGYVAEQILLHDRCELTPFEESVRLHQTFLKPLIAFYNQLTGNNDDNCPIT